MKTLVVGASGATGSKLVEQLLEMGHEVKVVVRSSANLPNSWKINDRVTIINGTLLEMGEEKAAEYLKDCDAAASCLGHNLSFKGLYGKPRRLVTDTLRIICNGIKKNAPDKKLKVVLMNTTGNQNRDLKEPISFGQKVVIGALRLLLPPHVDNEKASDVLRKEIGQSDDFIEWTAVRPDGLVDEDNVTPYKLHPSPTRSAIFDAGKTSRINVANFMAKLISDDDLWNKWKGQMPVIYNYEREENSD